MSKQLSALELTKQRLAAQSRIAANKYVCNGCNQEFEDLKELLWHEQTCEDHYDII